MRRICWLVVAVVAAMALPASASAADPSPSDFKNASKFCKAVKAQMQADLGEAAGETAFRQAFGTNKNRHNAHGKCVSRHASTVDDLDDNDSNAAQQCRAERGDTPQSQAAFELKYGTNKNKHNAFGKCVSGKAKQAEDDLVHAFGEAAKSCRTERGQTDASREAFRNKYGTNKNKRNAFGKCVSKLARQQHD
jgi:hypothetical protein